jgi:hypothetical protein
MYLIADTHGQDVKCCGELIHLGDCNGSKVLAPQAILIRGNHEEKTDFTQFDYICDGLILNNVLFTHEPQERLPKGCHFNICGHLHDDNPDDYGFIKKEFHIILPANKLIKITEILDEVEINKRFWAEKGK